MRTSGLRATGCAAALLLAGGASAQKASLVVTGNAEVVYPILTEEPPVENPQEVYEAALRKLRAADPDAVFVESGGFSSVSAIFETAYQSVPIRTMTQLKYPVVNLSARDAAFKLPVTFDSAPESFRKSLISGLRTEAGAPASEIPASKSVDSADGLKLTFVSLPSKGSLSGLPARAAMLQPVAPEKLRAAISEADAAKRITVGITSLSEEERTTTLGDALPKLDLLLVDRPDAPAEVVERSGTWTIRSPRSGEIYKIGLEQSEPGRIARPTVEKTTWMAASAIAQLIKYPLPRIGMPIPNLERITSDFFSVDAGSVRVDKFNQESLFAHTAWSTPHVYHVNLGEKTVRVYRVIATMPKTGLPMYSDPGWPPMDLLVSLNPDGTLERIANRNGLPVGGASTTLAEALQKLAGKPEAEWTPDPVLAGGIEECWSWGVAVIRQVQALDKAIYGPGGVSPAS